MELHTDDKIISRQSNWVFDEHVAPEFDKHVRKSVPNYNHVQELAETFSDWFTFPNSTVIDFGASTGETLRRIKRRHSKMLKLIGYDNSQAMIEQAKHKGIDITFADLEKPFELPELSYGVALYTLQFLRPCARYELLKRIYKQCGKRNWIALMGDNRANFFHRLPQGKTVLRFYSPVKHIFISKYVKCRMHFWSNLNVKDTLARIRRNQNSADGATWEVPTDISEDYLKMMESEHRIKKGNNWIWEQIGNRPNHYLDCESMNCAGALMLKIIGNDLT